MSWTGSGRASAFTSDAAALANLIFLFVIFGLLSIRQWKLHCDWIEWPFYGNSVPIFTH